MPPFQEMDPNLILKAIEGYENELEPAKKAQDAFYRQQECPRCHSSKLESKFISVAHAFGGDGVLPRSALKCALCDCVFDPHTEMILELGNVGKIQERVQPTQVPWVGRSGK